MGKKPSVTDRGMFTLAQIDCDVNIKFGICVYELLRMIPNKYYNENTCDHDSKCNKVTVNDKLKNVVEQSSSCMAGRHIIPRIVITLHVPDLLTETNTAQFTNISQTMPFQAYSKSLKQCSTKKIAQ